MTSSSIINSGANVRKKVRKSKNDPTRPVKMFALQAAPALPRGGGSGAGGKKVEKC